MTMSRLRIAIVTALACVAVTAVAVAPAQARQAGKGKQPNIVVIMTDDQALTDVAQLPNVKKLIADQGTSFTQAVDSFPLCCPARATFITGQYAHNHKVVGNFYPYGWYGMQDRGNILPAWLQKAGYRTGMVGKWLNGYGAQTQDVKGEKPKGFDIWRGLLDVSAYDYYNFVMSIDGKKNAYWGDKDFASKLVKFGNIQTIPKDEPVYGKVIQRLIELFGPPPYKYWGTEKEKDYTVDVTGNVFNGLVAAEKNQKKPFFLWWSPAAPHREDVATTIMKRPGPDPRAPKRYIARSKSFKLPQGMPSFNQDEASFSKLPPNMTEYLKPLTQAEIDQLQLDYEGRIGSLLAVDDHVKKIVATLKKTGQYKNTMIVFTSDNGWLQGQHRVPGDKFLPYEESVKVPYIIAGPGIPKGKTVDGQVSNVDFAATILDAAGAKAGRTQDGVSLIPVAKNPATRPDRAILLEAPEPLFASASMPNNKWDKAYKGVRTGDWKYVIYRDSGAEELYDLKADPYEINNLAGDPAYAATKARLIAKLEQLKECSGSACTAVPSG
ncbi:MAG: sulfatase [Solirubrobacteraceae bacterium]|nr:sulfatase [Solirubrobacteraceae bacterium]